MTNLSDYEHRYSTAKLHRTDGILVVQFHSDGESLRFGRDAHAEWPLLFREIAQDAENKVVILTGTGDHWTAPQEHGKFAHTPITWNATLTNGIELPLALLSIAVPVISAINGPVTYHTHVPLMSDIVLACPEAYFQDVPHLRRDVLPGDGVHTVFSQLMGRVRANYFLLLGDELSAAQAHDFGLINEIVPRERLLERAHELARRIAAYSDLNRRYSRLLFVRELRRALDDSLALGLALEGLGAIDAGATGAKSG